MPPGRVVAAAVVAFLAFTTQASADYVKSFESVVRIQSDGSVDVTDTIVIAASGDHRSSRFTRVPLRGGWGDVQVIEVLRDGVPEDWRLVGDNILTSTDDEPLRRGMHIYSIRFRVPNQVFMFKDRDSIIWFVTGAPVHRALDPVSVILQAPPGAKFVGGRVGLANIPYDTKQEFSEDGTESLRLWLKEPLPPGQIFGVYLEIEPGFVTRPPLFEKLLWQMLRSNIASGVAALFGVIGFYLLFLVRGCPRARRPYSTAGSVSPAAARLLYAGRLDSTALLAAIVGLVSKGHATLKQEPDGSAHVDPADLRGVAKPLSGDEAILYKCLFGSGEAGISLTGNADNRLIDAFIALQSYVESRLIRRSGLDRRYWLVAGHCLAIAATLLVGATSAGPAHGLVVAGAFGFWTTAFVLFIWFDAAIFRALVDGERGVSIAAALFAPLLTVYLLYQSAKWFSICLELLGIAGPGPVTLSVLLTLVSFLLHRSRIDFRPDLRDKIEKMRQRLASYRSSETDRNNTGSGRITTSDPFLPYAIALGASRPSFDAVDDAVNRSRSASKKLLDWRAGHRLDGQIPAVGVVVDLGPPRR